MKCVGSEDGTKPCQRCKRANVESVIFSHPRDICLIVDPGVFSKSIAVAGNRVQSKPYSLPLLFPDGFDPRSNRLSEASKMLRRLEKGLTSAKLKSQANAAANSSDTTPSDQPYCAPNDNAPTHFPGNELPPLDISAYRNRSYASPSVSADGDDDSDSQGRSPVEIYPAKMIRKENFFKTILHNPEDAVPGLSSGGFRASSRTPPSFHKHTQSQSSSKSFPAPLGPDPITAGILDENQATVLFDLVFLRLNPFVNLFDPALHSVHYVRSRCPLLFTTLIMAGAKFFKPEIYRPCQKLANELAFRAFAEGWKSVEVVQAFVCLVYWREPDDTRTWTYVGYVSVHRRR